MQPTGRMPGVRWVVPTVQDRFLTLQDRLRASQGRLEAPLILVPGAGQSRSPSSLVEQRMSVPRESISRVEGAGAQEDHQRRVVRSPAPLVQRGELAEQGDDLVAVEARQGRQRRASQRVLHLLVQPCLGPAPRTGAFGLFPRSLESPLAKTTRHNSGHRSPSHGAVAGARVGGDDADLSTCRPAAGAVPAGRRAAAYPGGSLIMPLQVVNGLR